VAIASGLNIYRGDSFTFEMNIFTYAKNLSLRRDVSELVASSFFGLEVHVVKKQAGVQISGNLVLRILTSVPTPLKEVQR